MGMQQTEEVAINGSPPIFRDAVTLPRFVRTPGQASG